jgi:hypothetical protein
MMFTFEGVVEAVLIVGFSAIAAQAVSVWAKFTLERNIPFAVFLSPFLLIVTVFLSWVFSQ